MKKAKKKPELVFNAKAMVKAKKNLSWYSMLRLWRKLEKNPKLVFNAKAMKEARKNPELVFNVKAIEKAIKQTLSCFSMLKL